MGMCHFSALSGNIRVYSECPPLCQSGVPSRPSWLQHSTYLSDIAHSSNIMSDDPMADFLAREKAALGELSKSQWSKL